MEPVIRVTWHVIAYDSSWGGYGIDSGGVFHSEEEALAHIEELPKSDPNLYDQAILHKTISVDPISMRVDWKAKLSCAT